MIVDPVPESDGNDTSRAAVPDGPASLLHDARVSHRCGYGACEESLDAWPHSGTLSKSKSKSWISRGSPYRLHFVALLNDGPGPVEVLPAGVDQIQLPGAAQFQGRGLRGPRRWQGQRDQSPGPVQRIIVDRKYVVKNPILAQLAAAPGA
ncbi:hypothetical protein ACFVVU_00310 [Kitasatospora sp. NPDC057965]|uniref:hypothetical protein n=1 Tax=Kitasatospora sp. NPDC057965 TaxID=3346291 RepID=UPI0036D94472